VRRKYLLEDAMTTNTPYIATPVRHPAIKVAAILCFIHGVGWPVGLAPTIAYMIQNRKLRVVASPMGQIRGLSGPFEVLGIDAMILLAVIFCVINLLHLLAGFWLWKSYRKGGVLAISLLAVSAVFWWGFALPIPPVVGLLLAGLLTAGRKSLKGGTS
jgi:hypothetical protein